MRSAFLPLKNLSVALIIGSLILMIAGCGTSFWSMTPKVLGKVKQSASLQANEESMVDGRSICPFPPAFKMKLIPDTWKTREKGDKAWEKA